MQWARNDALQSLIVSISIVLDKWGELGLTELAYDMVVKAEK
jgi:hypothetical protein